MSKLVLFLADGTTLDVPLRRERMTIGRRADNDICLPNLAVSGEHAAVVTILADSFLEDLGSTNGTLVNGEPIAKHFSATATRSTSGATSSCIALTTMRCSLPTTSGSRRARR